MTESIRFGWELILRCKDCGAVHVLDENSDGVSLSLTFANEKRRTRIALIHLPNECPDCHNLRVVPPADGA
jgi:ribosomal protein S27E